MSFEATLHAEHEARLARFALAAAHPKVKQKPATLVYTTRASVFPIQPLTVPACFVARSKPRHDIFNPQEERAWMVEMEGLVLEDLNTGPTIEAIQRAVCMHFGITRNDMLSHHRNQSLVIPRQVATYLCRKLTSKTLTDIGRRFGRDHSTQIHAIRKLVRLLETDMHARASVEMLMVKFGGAPG